LNIFIPDIGNPIGYRLGIGEQDNSTGFEIFLFLSPKPKDIEIFYISS